MNKVNEEIRLLRIQKSMYNKTIDEIREFMEHTDDEELLENGEKLLNEYLVKMDKLCEYEKQLLDEYVFNEE